MKTTCRVGLAALGWLVAVGCSEQSRVVAHRARAEQARQRGDVDAETRALEDAYRSAKTPKLRAEQAQALVIRLAVSGRFADAEPYAREAVELQGQVSGPDSAQTARALVLHGRILGDLERFAEAVGPLERARANAEKRSVEVMEVFALLASAYLRQGKVEQAERSARPGTASGLSPECRALSWGALGEVYRMEERWADATAACREAVRAVDGKASPLLASMQNNLAWSLALGGEGAEAERAARTALKLADEAKVAPASRAGYLDTLALALLVNGKAVEAEAITRSALAKAGTDRQRAYYRSTLAQVLAAQHRTADALAEFQAAVDLKQHLLPVDRARHFQAYARLLREQGRESEAAGLEQEAAALRLPFRRAGRDEK